MNIHSYVLKFIRINKSVDFNEIDIPFNRQDIYLSIIELIIDKQITLNKDKKLIILNYDQPKVSQDIKDRLTKHETINHDLYQSLNNLVKVCQPLCSAYTENSAYGQAINVLNKYKDDIK